MLTAQQALEISKEKPFSGVDEKVQINEIMTSIESDAAKGKQALVCYSITEKNIKILNALGFKVVQEIQKLDGIYKHTVLW